MSARKELTAQELFDWADRYARRREKRGEGTQYPTLRQAARRFRTTYAEVEDVAAEGVEDGYLGVAVGMRVGSMSGEIGSRADHLVEAYR